MTTSKKKPTVLLLSAPIGSGHRLAAEALKQVFLKKNVTVIHGNVFDFFPQFIGNAFLKIYLVILKVCPVLYKYAYQWGNKQNSSLIMRNALNYLLAQLGSAYIKKVNPDAVIATHATPAGIMSIYKKKHQDLYLCGVITDYTVHKWWLCTGINTYFIADRRLQEKITLPAEVKAYGIPVREAFKILDKKDARRRFGWHDNETVCLLIGGGEGLLPMDELIKAINTMRFHKIRFIAATGNNKYLKEKLLPYEHTEVYSFTDQLPQLMAGADIIISKAGGLSSAEILTLQNKFIIYKPLPGQEEGNAAFLRSNYGVAVAYDITGIKRAVTEYMEQKDAGKVCFNTDCTDPSAAEKICDHVLQKITSY